MKGLIQKSGYIKSGSGGGHYAEYIATRDGVELASGVDAKTLSGILGHTNASFTLDTYTHVTPGMQRAASDVVGGFLEDLLGKELNPWPENEKAEPAL